MTALSPAPSEAQRADAPPSGKRPWVPLLQAFYPPLRDRVAEVKRTTRRADFTTTATDEVCSLGHPMVKRLGRNGEFLACSQFPDHKESRPLPGEEQPPQAGQGESCPECGIGTLAGKRGRFGPFVGCDRYPDCKFIKRDGPEPPAALPFEVVCPKNADGKLVARRARASGNVFFGCSNYPKCDYTTNHEPIGDLHETDDGPVAKKADAFLCLKCGAAIEVPGGDVVGLKLAGGPPDPAALASARRSGGRPGGRSGAGGKRTGAGSGPRRGAKRTTRAAART